MNQIEQIDKDRLADLEKKFEEIISSDPESNTFCVLAEVQYKLGKIDKATGVLIRGLSHNKNNITARVLLGKIYYERWLIDQAKKEMEKVLELSPDNLEAAKLLSEIYQSEDKHTDALEILESLYVFHNNNEDLIKDIGILKEEVSKKEGKSQIHVFQTPIDSRKVNEIKTDDSEMNIELHTEAMLNLYIEQGEFDKARDTIEHLYKSGEEKSAAIENLEKTKLNKMNNIAGFESKN